jgi:hypothetical protein
VKPTALLLALVPAPGAACGGTEPIPAEKRIMLDAQCQADLETLRGVPIYFGHHSVGDNILQGLRALTREAGVELSIHEQRVGENAKPLQKFEDFARHAEDPRAPREQLLLMKLCFVDFTPDSQPAALVEAYAQVVERVRKARPDARLVHVTPPLCARPADLKSKLKRTLGTQVWEDDCNARRAEFRELLLARFPGQTVLDLGGLESTRPDGTRELHSVGGKPVPMLWPGYTDDGGHLNETGRLLAAKAFVRALAQARRG